MAETATSPDIYWIDPRIRGIIPLDNFHLPRKLARKIRQTSFEIRIDTAFTTVIEGCAACEENKGRQETWINDWIIDLYHQLYDNGYVHTVECWQKGKMVGGLYGVSIGGVFCGESMFHTVSDASKVALAYLVARLKAGGYCLLDTQFITPHLSQFGAIGIPRHRYKMRLQEALKINGNFYCLDIASSAATISHFLTHTS